MPISQNGLHTMRKRFLVVRNQPRATGVTMVGVDLIDGDSARPHSTAEDVSTGVLHRLAEQGVAELRSTGLYREFVECDRLVASPGRARQQGVDVDVWCSNDYLGLSQHPVVVDAFVEAARTYGIGSGGSRNIAGTTSAHVRLERELAQWHDKESAVLFNSGYAANFEFLSTILAKTPDIVVFSDQLNHRSLIEGIRRARCERHVFRHRDLEHLEELLRTYPREQPKAIVVESIYSMDGDISDLPAICDLADRYGAMTFVDETHAVAVIGPTGAGVCEAVGEHRVTFVQGVLSKGMGVSGGYVAGPAVILDYVRSVAPGFIFTTPLPHATAEAALASLELVRGSTGLRESLLSNAGYLKAALQAKGIDTIDGESHLVLVVVPGAQAIGEVARRMLAEHRTYIQPINFPTVPLGSERFRLAVTPWRSKADIDAFVEAFSRCVAEVTSSSASEELS